MKIIVTKDYEEMSKRAADVIFAQVLISVQVVVAAVAVRMVVPITAK